MPTTINATQTPVLSQWMEQADAADLARWAEWADAELQQLRQVNANLESELAALIEADRCDANERDAEMEDELNADRWQREEWFPDFADRDAMLPELLASPLYGHNVHS